MYIVFVGPMREKNKYFKIPILLDLGEKEVIKEIKWKYTSHLLPEDDIKR